MLRNIEKIAVTAGLCLKSVGDSWTPDDYAPHISTFRYELQFDHGEDPEAPELRRIGSVDGYRIAQDWTLESELELWREAELHESDVVDYVEALVREVRVCQRCFVPSPKLAKAQRITIVRHVELAPGSDAIRTRDTVASLALMDAPTFMLVDPWRVSDARRTPAAKLEGKARIAFLRELGFSRMVGSRYLWAWNREMATGQMSSYSYETVASAKQDGELDEILRKPLCEPVSASMIDRLSRATASPDPDELLEE